MKRIMKIALAITVVMMTATSFALAQEKEVQQKIKIVVEDKNGREVVVDTTLSHVTRVDSIRLNDGKILYINEGDDFTTSHITGGGEGDHIVIVKSVSGKQQPEGENKEILAWVSAGSDAHGHSTVHISNEGEALKDGEKRYDIKVTTDESGKEIEKTSYVLSKNGMVVTIEGDNEEKVKELAALIEAKLGAGKTDSKK
jgi:hypothetical protein